MLILYEIGDTLVINFIIPPYPQGLGVYLETFFPSIKDNPERIFRYRFNRVIEVKLVNTELNVCTG